MGNCACFLCLLIILKSTLDYFYDASKHTEPRTYCNSCNVHNFLFRVTYYIIRSIAWLCSAQCLLVRQRQKTVGASLLNAKSQFCCNGLTLSEGKISTSTSPLETETIFNLLSLPADPGVVSSISAWLDAFVEFDHEIILSDCNFFHLLLVSRQRCIDIETYQAKT